ncbi:hypothetical protein DTL70_05890 [Streptomyces diacarni]|uniref:Uncharacterized protein n=1 Tax=Streptomyces diacarni TaxID=2800381 RepID=A0A367F9D3_9ACTN|nr:hypothetical protein DTL70_05890 [Streptomyces diacarni]
MGVFAKILRRSSTKSTQDTPESTPAEEAGTGTFVRRGARDGTGSGGTEPTGPRAGAEDEHRAGDEATRESPPEESSSHATPPVPESTETSGDGPAADGREDRTAARVENSEGAVGIPKQQSADEAADSETGDNARK